MANDLKNMSRKQLEKLRGDIDKQLAKMDQQDQKAARSAAEKAAKQHGFSLDELIGTAPAKRAPKGASKPKGEPQFRNPADPKQTWTGKGRKPNWFIEATKAGKSEDDLRIK